MSKERSNTLKVPLYGNCRVQNPEGTHIFNCGEKKAKWYLKRDLAQVIQESPLVIRLNFVPNGQGHANDSFYLQERQNLCVVCGITDKLTKHHVVPYCYRRFFPEKLKNHTAYDVLPLCYECHEKYETSAHQFKKKLTEELAIPKGRSRTVDTERKNVCLAASALLRHRGDIPQERLDYLIETLRQHYGRSEISIEDLENASQLEYNTRRQEYKPEGQAVVESVDDIESFVKRWRQHFVDTMNPQHMPRYWVVDRPL
jgi:hypothetical protein